MSEPSRVPDGAVGQPTEGPATVRGHDQLVARFRACAARQRLGNAYLFVGPEGVGKTTFAIWLAQGLLCQTRPGRLDPCGECDDCRQVRARTHPDLLIVRKPSDRAFLPLRLLVGRKDSGDAEHGFCQWVRLTPYSRIRKIGIIDDADYFNEEGANALLKTLEEPPDTAVLILIGTSEHRQLPTIRSRCQVIRFGLLPRDVIADLAIEQGICSDRAGAEQAARYANGSLAAITRSADEGLGHDAAASRETAERSTRDAMGARDRGQPLYRIIRNGDLGPASGGTAGYGVGRGILSRGVVSRIARPNRSR